MRRLQGGCELEAVGWEYAVVVVGGVGSLLGSVVSAGFLGQLNGIFAMLSNDILARAIVFGAVILIIAWRPNGLFNFRGR